MSSRLPPPLYGPANETPSAPFFGDELQFGPICQVKRPCPRGTLTKEDVAFLKANYGCSASVRCRDPKNDQTREVIVSARVGGLLENTASVSNNIFQGPLHPYVSPCTHFSGTFGFERTPSCPKGPLFSLKGPPFGPETGQLFSLRGELFSLKGQLFCLKGQLFSLKGKLFSLKGPH